MTGHIRLWRLPCGILGKPPPCGAQNSMNVITFRILTAAAVHPRFICHWQRSDVLPKAGTCFGSMMQIRILIPKITKKEALLCKTSFFVGRGDRTRTCGILLPKQARYQLRYTSINNM